MNAKMAKDDDKSVSSVASAKVRKDGDDKPVVCCVHGIKCKKGRRERADRTDVFSLLNFYLGAIDRRSVCTF